MEKTARAYSRCNSGHYFSGEVCPLDGWSSPQSKELSETSERLMRAGQDLSIAELKKAGLSKAAAERSIVIDFGSPAAAFDAIAPEGYVIDRKWWPLAKLGREFK